MTVLMSTSNAVTTVSVSRNTTWLIGERANKNLIKSSQTQQNVKGNIH